MCVTTKRQKDKGAFSWTITKSTNSIRMSVTDITGSGDANSVKGKLHYHVKNTNNMMNELKWYANRQRDVINRGHAFISIYYAGDYLESKQSSPSMISSKESHCAPVLLWSCWTDKVVSIHGWRKDERGSLNISSCPCSFAWLLVRTWACFLEGGVAF